MRRLPLLPVLVAAAIVGLGLVTAFYPHPSAFLRSSTARNAYAPGDPIELFVTLSVGGNVPITFRGSPCKLAFAVETSTGNRIFDSRLGVACGQMIVELTLQPGEELAGTFTWHQLDDSGMPVPSSQDYTIVPILGLSSPVKLTVTAAQIVVS